MNGYQYKDTTTVISIGGLAPIMLVNDIRIGTDKIGHFFQLGYSHYYKKTVGPGALSRDDAIKEGNKTEAGMFGLGVTGVYSRADIEANKWGLFFYEELAKSPNMAFDIRRYINWNWNEQVNPNLYGGGLHNLWRDSIPGKWDGTFKWGDGATAETAVCHADFKITGARSLDDLKNGISNIEGTYQYKHPSASYTSGVLTGKIAEKKNSDGAVYTLELTLDWKEGTAQGKGTMTMVTMYQLFGKWGRGTSDVNGGEWIFHKVNI